MTISTREFEPKSQGRGESRSPCLRKREFQFVTPKTRQSLQAVAVKKTPVFLVQPDSYLAEKRVLGFISLLGKNAQMYEWRGLQPDSIL